MKKWTIDYYDQAIQDWVANLPVGLRATYARLSSLMVEYGIDLRLPYSRALGDGLFELRLKGKEGIARIFYCTLIGKRIVILHGFIKKTQEIPKIVLEKAIRRMREVKHESKTET